MRAGRGGLREVVEEAVASDSRLAWLADWANHQNHHATVEAFKLVVGDLLDEEAKQRASDLVWSIVSTQTVSRLIHRRGGRRMTPRHG